MLKSCECTRRKNMQRSVLKGQVPLVRLDCVNERAENPGGRFVLYWMTAFRRMSENFALDRAIEIASELHKPLLVVETLEAGHHWVSDRHHTFVLQGMADNKAVCEGRDLRYYPFVEAEPGEIIEFLEALAERSCVVVTDEFPINDFSAEVAQVVSRIDVRMEQVDSNGLLPIRAADRQFSTAHAFRRFLQQRLPEQMLDAASLNPLSRLKLPTLRGLPSQITRRWPSVSSKLLDGDLPALARLPIDHEVVSVGTVGGSSAATATLRDFLKRKLADYPKDRNHPDADGTSGLSPYLHHGHISAQQIFRELAKAEGWSPPDLGEKVGGVCPRRRRLFSTSWSPGARSVSIAVSIRKITTDMNRCPNGLR
jgi:deoxyribodipyrimidine photo-lyase